MQEQCSSSLDTSKTAITGLTSTHNITTQLNILPFDPFDVKEAEEQKRREETIHSTPDNNSNRNT